MYRSPVNSYLSHTEETHDTLTGTLKVMADAGGHSSGEYSGVVEEADVGKTGKAQDMATVLSSGTKAQEKRKANREKKEKEEREKERGKTDSEK